MGSVRMNDAMVLMVLNRKWGLICVWSIFSSIAVASLRWVSISTAAICVARSWAKPWAMERWVSVILLALR